MKSVTALAFCGAMISCTHETDMGNSGNNLGVVETYEKAFISRFGEPSADADWGFGTSAKAGTRANNPGENHNATSTGINANANEWADPTPGKEFGGWVVPDPLTEEQKEIVRKYFQAVPNLTYEDPKLRHFFVQQVYKGGTNKPDTGNKETNTSAIGTPYSSDNMNLLTVGYNEQHINNFNSGNYGATTVATDTYGNPLSGTIAEGGMVNVLDEGYTANDFANHHHPDQIMLMVNIDDTECMGYHNSGCSKQKNDKAALVDWTVIRDWANAHGLNGNCLDDKWNRSFVGFDFELYSLEDSYLKSNGEIVYAKMTDGQNGGLQYVWDGKNVVTKGTEGVSNQDLTSRFTGLWNENESKEVNSDGAITYHAVAWGGISAFLDCDIDFSPYQSIVIEFAEATTVTTQLVLEYGAKGYSWNQEYKFSVDAGATQLELNFANNYVSNLDHIRQVALQAADAADIKISKIYLKGKEGEAGFGNYLLVNGKKVPFLITNMNMYSGILYGGKDEALNDSEMKINKDGKECFNMERIAQLVADGYLPVKDKNLRTWVKWQGGDGYFSDWIVTLAKAKRIGEKEEEEEEEPITAIRVIAEDLNVDSNSDFDFNDVVFDVTWVSESKVKIKLLAAGGTLPLTVGWNGEGENWREYEVHYLLGYTDAAMINTHANVGIHYDGVAPYEFEFNGSFSKDNFAADVRDNIPVKVKRGGVWYPINADQGKAAGKLAVGTDYEPWCNEREDIDDWWQNNNLQGLFSKYTQNPTELTKYWYRSYTHRKGVAK